MAVDLEAGLIAREHHPDNLEAPHRIFDRFLTPPELFYVRNHFEMPRVDPHHWKLTIEGEVHQALELDAASLRGMPNATLTATLECAGNNRMLLPEPVKGVQWELGAVGTAEWSGVPLADLLDRARINQGAVEVIFEGTDRGRIDSEPKTPGEIPFARSVPLAKAREALLAWAMNGQELPERHGFPLRVIVPGWYGMASVKWLRRIVVTSRPFQGYFQTFEYSRWNAIAGIPSLAPLGAGEVKAEMAFPAAGENVPRDARYRAHGAAWAGESAIESVEISSDAGETWRPAKLLDAPRRYCWTRWEYEWQTPATAGDATLMARARDAGGRVQPWTRDKLERSYSVHHVLPVDVTVV
ncbi:MAG TPA: sulfite oxidase [Bryobacteraceae bacterium]|nr:sulfite oxidase [Bryobacteraceae bacterium]